MKKSKFVLVITSLLFLLVSYNTCIAADRQGDRAHNGLTDLYKILDTRQSTHSYNSKLILAKDSDRGCCVWKAEKSKCAFTNEGYCKHKAKEANVKFEFYKDVPCKGLPVCN